MVTMGLPNEESAAFLDVARQKASPCECTFKTINIGTDIAGALPVLNQAIPDNATVFLIKTDAAEEDIALRREGADSARYQGLSRHRARAEKALVHA
ncbi:MULTISPECIES: hypothetical protein [unclassified Variovorax]|nr:MULTISPECIES: hypothetical protein [unclassified Variovorax]KWT67141.1 hypothetical protein APY03_7111 [Variovorax sp. WDL1]PNG47444.1 hypothetical protein CHC06_07794 [Variovorax sp. B2]PNG47905.1 hypothetical protein CHC07_07074 [Variovorax sp. B4]VTV15357.1 hypothetical protein WDL1CHR_05769 [Variovorax sp. WDL1]